MEYLVFEENYSNGGQVHSGYYVWNAKMAAKKLTEIVIPAEYNGLPVTYIHNYAFNYLKKLERVGIPESIRAIGCNAFAECKSLVSVALPAGLSSLGAGAFSFCKSLKEITVPGSITKINKDTFFNCSALEVATVCEGVTDIGKNAFWNCKNLKTVSLPASLTHVGECAFDYCEKLTDIYFGGSEEAWKKITVDGGNQRLLAASTTIHYFSRYNAADFAEGYNSKYVI